MFFFFLEKFGFRVIMYEARGRSSIISETELPALLLFLLLLISSDIFIFPPVPSPIYVT